MGRRFVQQLTDGESIEEVYLVTDKQLRANRNGNSYLQLELRDRSAAITAFAGCFAFWAWLRMQKSPWWNGVKIGTSPIDTTGYV